MAGGYVLVVWVLRMDLEWMHTYIRLAGEGIGCGLCKANATDIPWTACTHGVAWIGTIWDHVSHAAACPNRNVLLRHVPGCSVLAYIPDWLHTKHVGVDGYVLGSVFVALFTQAGLPGSDIDKRNYIWREIKLAYTHLHITECIQALTFGMIQSAGSKLPQLKLRGNQMEKL